MLRPTGFGIRYSVRFIRSRSSLCRRKAIIFFGAGDDGGADRRLKDR